MQTADETLALPERLAAPLDTGQRPFHVALALALLVHAAIFIEVGRSVPRTMGDRSGATDAIAVDLVTEADLQSLESVKMPSAGAPTPPVTAAVQPQPEPAPAPQLPPEAQQPKPAEPATEAPAAREAPQEPKPEAAPIPDFESVVKDLATTPLPSEPEQAPPSPSKAQQQKQEPAEAKAAQKPPQPPAKQKPQQQARIDPSQQQMLDAAPPGRSAAASRPPGITRSGENDDFGRAVVHALRQTMPPPRGVFGRVTVRLILTENGDLAEVRVLDASGTSLDQNVVFAVKQTYFPLPPYKATVADRTFLISYIYK